MAYTRVTVPITGKTEKDVLRQAEIIAGTPEADDAEWRFDLLENGQLPDVSRLVPAIQARLRSVPLIFTFRTEGQNKQIPPEHYREILLSARDAGAEIIDCEALRGKNIVNELQNGKTKVIASFHDFEKTPSENEMLGLLSLLEASGADEIKLAVMTNAPADSIKIRNVCRIAALAVPFSLMGMGVYGTDSRMNAQSLGCRRVFCALFDASAPGQVRIDEYLKRKRD